ncbi:2-C-methyl-D-erythritol 2,4-cyclodiphosphate synthase [Halanaerobaculum tunisiense]
MRVGIGSDVHALEPEEELVLAGVQIDYQLGLVGHSDADVVLHAIMDALLGAIGAGDIGRHFPATDPQYKGISSLLLLEEVVRIVADQDYQVNNLDVVIKAEQPKLAPYLTQMEDKLAQVLEVDNTRINIKATTTEGLGFVGRQEGIASQAIVSLNNF